MNRKITLGAGVLVLGLYYLFRNIFPNLLETFDYILNYKTFLIVAGLVYIFKGQAFGWVLFLIGGYLLLNDLMPNLAPIIFPILLLVSGVILIVLGIKENRKWR
ncbi:MAG: hypothetical protein IJG31_06060 [Fusobacterium sp.]|nr:hypothetical protein [Fusobacterium sp.]